MYRAAVSLRAALLWQSPRHYTKITAHYIDTDGTKKTIEAEKGTNMLTAAHQNDIDLEGI
jgi:hypothetical protein